MQKSLVKRQFKRILVQYEAALKIRSETKLDKYIYRRSMYTGLCRKVAYITNDYIYIETLYTMQ